MTDPKSPFGPLSEGAISIHELMESYIEAGFTRDEAHALLCVILSATIQSGGSR